MPFSGSPLAASARIARHAVRHEVIGFVGSGLTVALFLLIIGPCPSPDGKTYQSGERQSPKNHLARSRNSRKAARASAFRVMTRSPASVLLCLTVRVRSIRLMSRH